MPTSLAWSTGNGRFLDGRRVSTLRAHWTNLPDYLIDRSTRLDVSVLSLVVPFGLLPASDARLSRSAEWLLQNRTVSGDPNAMARWTLEPSFENHHSSKIHLQDADSLGTLWMARYLIQHGRETGQGRLWNRALAMLDGVIGRLQPLGLSMRTMAPAVDPASLGRMATSHTSGSWTLHGMLIETLLDFAGLDYKAVGRTLTLDPILPTSWAHTGLTQMFPCGEVSYRLERPIGGTVYQLSLRANLRHRVHLTIGVTCPNLPQLGPWQASTPGPEPVFRPRTGRISFSIDLPEGESSHNWTWG
ncbi:MAG: hypothetical protein U0794_09045 [Isosphaeraceae bacterium]